jgi:hypothetical protein
LPDGAIQLRRLRRGGRRDGGLFSRRRFRTPP